jgi:hypothetical protein
MSKIIQGYGVAQVIECLSSQCNALSSNSVLPKKDVILFCFIILRYLFINYLFIVVQGIKPRALSILGKHSITELHPQSLRRSI